MVNTNKNKQRRTVGAALLCSLCCVFSLNFGKAVRDHGRLILTIHIQDRQ